MMASTRSEASSPLISCHPPSPLPPASSKRPPHHNSPLPPPTDHTTAHAAASLTDDSALDHLMSALHLDHDHSNPHLPPLYPSATPHAVRAHLAAMGYDQVPHDTLAAIVDDLNAGQRQQQASVTSSTAASTSSNRRRRRKHANVTINDQSYLSSMHEPMLAGEHVVDLTTLDDLSLSTAAAAGGTMSFDTHAAANATTATTTLTRPELETYLLDMGYAPSDLDTALVDDLLEALNESVVMGQETMMSMMRGQAEEERATGFTGTVMAEEADRTELGGRQYRSAGEVHWEMDGNDSSRAVDGKRDTFDERVHQEQTNSFRASSSQRSWSPARSASSTYSTSSHSRAYKPSSSSFRAFRAPPPTAPRTPANDPVLRYHQYARAWSNSPFLVRREREAGNAGASVWSLASSTAAAAATQGGSTLMSHSRASGTGRAGARPASKWDDSTLDQSYASSAEGGRTDKDRDVWAVRDWIKAPGSGAGGRRSPSSNR